MPRIFATIAYSIAGAGDAAVTKALFDLDLGLDGLDGLAAGLFVLAAAVGLKRTASIPAWLAWAGFVVAALLFLRATTWAKDGFWSPAGDYTSIAIICGLAVDTRDEHHLVRPAPSASEAENPPASCNVIHAGIVTCGLFD